MIGADYNPDQGQLFPHPHVGELVQKHKEFIATEVQEGLIDGDLATNHEGIFEIRDEKGVLTALDVLTIAAEGLARDFAHVHGAVDADSDELFSENLAARIIIKADSKVSEDPFEFDVDHGSEFASGAGLSLEEFVEALTQRATRMAQIAVQGAYAKNPMEVAQ